MGAAGTDLGVSGLKAVASAGAEDADKARPSSAGFTLPDRTVVSTGCALEPGFLSGSAPISSPPGAAFADRMTSLSLRLRSGGATPERTPP